MPSDSARPDPTAKRALLQDLAAALTTISQRLRTLEASKRMIFLLAARAEAIAEQSLAVSTMKAGDIMLSAQELATQIQALSASFAELSERVADDISAERGQAETLVAQAARLLQMVAAADAGSSDRLARLQPLAASLASLAGRRRSDKSAAEEVTGLAGQAQDLADRAQGMTAGANAQAVRRICADLYGGLRGIADDAATVSHRIEAEAALLTAAVSAMAAAAQRMVRQESAAAPIDQPTARIQQMVRKGQAAMDW